MKILRTKTYSIYKKLVLQDKRSLKLNFSPDGREYYVYRVTDIDTKEYYYGSRISKKDNLIDDFWNYCTSSKRKKLIKENKENYKVKIIKVFNNSSDMLIYESFLHQYFNVKESGNRFFNRANQTPFGFDTTNKKKVYKDNKIIMVDVNNNKYVSFHKNKVSVKDINLNHQYISIFDSRYKKELLHSSTGLVPTRYNGAVSIERFYTEKLIHPMKNKVVVKDLYGNITTQEKDYNKAEYKALSKDHKIVRDKSGNCFRVHKDNFQYEEINKNKTIVKNKEGITLSLNINDPRITSGEFESIQKGFVSVKDSNGNFLRVKNNDPRFLNNELVGVGKGFSVVYDLYSKRREFIRIPTNIVKANKTRYIGTTKKIKVLYNNSSITVTISEYINNSEYILI